MNREVFLDATSTTQWATIDEIVSKLDDAGYWDEEFQAGALLDRKKAHVRRQMKSLKDENSWPMFANVVTRDADGNEARVYKQETLFDLNDYRQTVRYHVEAGQHHIRMAIGYRAQAFKRYQVQIPLPFGFTDEGAVAA